MSDNHRQHIRLYLDCRVFIELTGPPTPGEDHGEIALCKTLDISYGGLKVSLARELTIGALLQIGIEFPGVEDTLFLTGEVKWCRRNAGPDAGWSAGFRLLQSDDSDGKKWRDLMLHV